MGTFYQSRAPGVVLVTIRERLLTIRERLRRDNQESKISHEKVPACELARGLMRCQVLVTEWPRVSPRIVCGRIFTKP